MKSFLELYEEQEKTSKPVVMAFGRMNPPTTGHLKLIHKVKELADKHNAKHTVVVSHSQDSKKNPLSAEQKLKHLKRYEPSVHFQSSSKEHPTFLQHAAELHKKGHDHLIYVAGSDRVKEMHDKLHQYNGTHKGALYNFKKIQVVSAGHRDPDAEGAEGMSGTKMREHAKNNDFHSFRQGVPHHVPDKHARELMHDVRKGMGLHESVDHGQFKAIFVTGGPGSGKDVVIRECVAESNAVEFNLVQAFDYLTDKGRLSQKQTGDLRLESIRSRKPLIINGPAEDMDRINYIKEELEDMGYSTMMIFVDTSNEASKERNEKLTRMMVESVRQDKWVQAQRNKEIFIESFDKFTYFDNTRSYSEIEQDITEMYQNILSFLEENIYNDTAVSWLENHGKLNINDKFNILFKEHTYVESDSKSTQTKTTKRYNPFFVRARSESRAAGPADITPDNRKIGTEIDDLRGNLRPRKDPTRGNSVTGGAWSSAYEAANPTLKVNPPAKEPNFQQDKDKTKKKRFGDQSLSAARVAKPTGLGREYDSRAGGQGAAAGAGLGQNLYGETQEYSNASPSSSAMPGSSALQPNPLNNGDVKSFKKFRKTIKEYNGFQNDAESGLGGVLGGAGNKEGMDSYKDPMRNIGIQIKKKKKQEK